MYYPLKLYIIVDILGVLLDLVNNDMWNEALPIRLSKDK